jgi:hypothetical protein
MSGSTRFLRNTCQLLINAETVHVEVPITRTYQMGEIA